MKFNVINDGWQLAYANDNDALIPEIWANESLAILEENMVIGNLIHRDFSNEVANFGDVVNTRKPAEFVGKRKTDDDSVTIQDATSTNIAVALNQHLHTSFMIKDGEESKSMKELVDFYLRPAMIAQARFVDQVLCGQAIRFQAYSAGTLGVAITENALIATRKVMNDNKVPMDGRNLLVCSRSESDMLKIQNFVQAYAVGDEGTALREAALTKKYGFNIFMCQNIPDVESGNTVVTAFLVNNASNYAAGTTTMLVDTGTGILQTGTWFTVVGDVTPHYVTAHTETLGNTTSITFTPALRSAVLNDAIITAYTVGQVNLVAGYTAGYAKEIVVDNFTVSPQVGQSVVFSGSPTKVYTIIGAPTTTSILLDRPLDSAVANDEYVGISPVGAVNFAFRRNALAMVSRPLAMPKSGTGALAGVASYNNLGMRSVITYDGNKQGHLVTLDVLFGVQVLESLAGAVLFG